MTFLSAASVLNDIILIGLLAGFAGAVVIAVMLVLLTPLLPVTTWLREGSLRGLRRLAAVQDRFWRSSGSSEPARLGASLREAARERPRTESRYGLLDEFVDLAVLVATLFAGFLLIAVAVGTVGLDDELQSAANTMLSYALGPALVLAAAFPFFVLHNRSQELGASPFRRRVAHATLVVAVVSLALFAVIKAAVYLEQRAQESEWRSVVEILRYLPVPFFWATAALAVAGAAALADRGFYGLARVALYLAGAVLSVAVFAVRALVWLLLGVPVAFLAVVFVLAQLLALLPETVVNWLRRRGEVRRRAAESGTPSAVPVPAGPSPLLEEQVGVVWEPEMPSRVPAAS